MTRSRTGKVASAESAGSLIKLPKPGFARGLNAARKSELDQLCRIEQESFDARGRFWERTYLQAVYEVWWSWPSDEKTSFARQAARLFKIWVRPSSHPIRILIDCTSPATKEKMRSRWTLALRLAEQLNVPPSELEELGNKHGGVAGCARAYSVRRKKLAAKGREKLQNLRQKNRVKMKAR